YCSIQYTHFNSSALFFYDATATTEIYTLSLHDALPILGVLAVIDGQRQEGDALLLAPVRGRGHQDHGVAVAHRDRAVGLFGHLADRKSTRLNSSHVAISYAVFCLQKKTRPSTRRKSSAY